MYELEHDCAGRELSLELIDEMANALVYRGANLPIETTVRWAHAQRQAYQNLGHEISNESNRRYLRNGSRELLDRNFPADRIEIGVHTRLESFFGVLFNLSTAHLPKLIQQANTSTEWGT